MNLSLHDDLTWYWRERPVRARHPYPYRPMSIRRLKRLLRALRGRMDTTVEIWKKRE